MTVGLTRAAISDQELGFSVTLCLRGESGYRPRVYQIDPGDL